MDRWMMDGWIMDVWMDDEWDFSPKEWFSSTPLIFWLTISWTEKQIFIVPNYILSPFFCFIPLWDLTATQGYTICYNNYKNYLGFYVPRLVPSNNHVWHTGALAGDYQCCRMLDLNMWYLMQPQVWLTNNCSMEKISPCITECLLLFVHKAYRYVFLSWNPPTEKYVPNMYIRCLGSIKHIRRPYLIPLTSDKLLFQYKI